MPETMPSLSIRVIEMVGAGPSDNQPYGLAACVDACGLQGFYDGFGRYGRPRPIRAASANTGGPAALRSPRGGPTSS